MIFRANKFRENLVRQEYFYYGSNWNVICMNKMKHSHDIRWVKNALIYNVRGVAE